MPRNQNDSKDSDKMYSIRHDKILGRGSYSVVKLATHIQTQTNAAAKVVDLRSHSREFEQEVNALTRVNHPSIVACLHSEKSVDGKIGTIFLEYLPFPTLYQYIMRKGKRPECFSLTIFAQVIDAVCHLHSRNVAHNDLKPENLSFNEKKLAVKLFDFGLSESVNPTLTSTNFAGSPLYMAPEVLQRERHNPFLSDVWSLGVILYELLTGETPYGNCTTIEQLQDRIFCDNYIPLPDYLSQGAQDVINKMLSFNPNERPTAEQVQTYIRALRITQSPLTPSHLDPEKVEVECSGGSSVEGVSRSTTHSASFEGRINSDSNEDSDSSQ